MNEYNVLLKGKTQDITLGVDDAGLGPSGPIVEAQQKIRHCFSSGATRLQSLSTSPARSAQNLVDGNRVIAIVESSVKHCVETIGRHIRLDIV